MPSECDVSGMDEGIRGRGALAAPKGGEPSLTDRRVTERARSTRNGMLSLRRKANDTNDRGNEAMAVRKKPAR